MGDGDEGDSNLGLWLEWDEDVFIGGLFLLLVVLLVVI